MAFIWISEYARQAKDNRGQPIAAGEEPSLVVQRVAVAVGNTTSAALNPKTRYVRIHTDSICSYKVAPGVAVAAVTDARMAANQTEYFGLIEEQVKAAAGVTIGNILNT